MYTSVLTLTIALTGNFLSRLLYNSCILDIIKKNRRDSAGYTNK